MSLVKKGFSAVGRLFVVIALAGAFLVGMVGVVYMSLRGDTVQIPEVVGKDYYESEKQLEALGLKIKKVATRYSEEKPNTIIEQRPRAGETAKSGLLVSVIVSQVNPEGTEAPADVRKKKDDEKAIEEIEDLISDKPQKSKSNSNTKKKGSTTRDVIKDKSDDNNNSDSSGDAKANSNSDSSNKDTKSKDNKPGADNKNSANPADKKPSDKKPNPEKSPATKPATGGDTRTRKVPPNN